MNNNIREQLEAIEEVKSQIALAKQDSDLLRAEELQQVLDVLMRVFPFKAIAEMLDRDAA